MKRQSTYTIIAQRIEESDRRIIYRDLTKWRVLYTLYKLIPQCRSIHIRKNYMESNEADTAIKN